MHASTDKGPVVDLLAFAIELWLTRLVGLESERAREKLAGARLFSLISVSGLGKQRYPYLAEAVAKHRNWCAQRNNSPPFGLQRSDLGMVRINGSLRSILSPPFKSEF